MVEGVASSELRVSCCLCLLHCASSPWSSAVACLVQSCLPLTASCAQQLQSLYNLLQVQEILQEKYGIADFNFSDRTTGDVSDQTIVCNNCTVLMTMLGVHQTHSGAAEI